MDKKGGSSRFPSEFFCLTVPKFFLRQPFSMSLISGIENFYAPEGCVTISRQKFLVPQCRENFVGGPFCAAFQKNSGRHKVYG